MTLLYLAAFAVVVWWLWKSFPRVAGALYSRWRLLLGQALIWGVAIFFLTRGQFLMAGAAAVAGVWLSIGGNIPALQALVRGGGTAAIFRSSMLELTLRPTGQLDGFVRGGDFAGRPLGSLDPPELFALARACLRDDPEGFRLLETYLDRRLPGWRQHVDGAADGRQRTQPQTGIMTEQQAYEILGLQPGAGKAAITAAHRALMKKLHPDHGGATELAARVNQARDVLLRGHRVRS